MAAPPLAAGAVGAWLLTVAAGSAWVLREGDWGRFRATAPGLGLYLVLILVAAARYPEPLDAGDWQEWVFFAGIGAGVAAAGTAAWLQERRRTLAGVSGEAHTRARRAT